MKMNFAGKPPAKFFILSIQVSNWSFVMKFRVREKVGNHTENNCTYISGQVFESDRHLDEVFPDKFEKMPSKTPVSVPHGQIGKVAKITDDDDGDEVLEEMDLSALSVKELKQFAEENDIDVGTARKKADLIDAIEAATDSSDEDDEEEYEDDEEEYEDEE